MKAGVQRFAPHVEHLTGATLETPELEQLLGVSDVVVYATGAEDVLAKLRAGVQASSTATRPIPPRSSACWCR